MKVRRLEPKEEECFLDQEREAIYPGLSQGAMKEWVEGEGAYVPLAFVLERGGSGIGGSVIEVQDHLKGKKLLLQLDALFVLPAYRRQGLGTFLLNRSITMACQFYRGKGFEPVSLLIQTTSPNKGAAEFYRHFCQQLSFGCDEAVQRIEEGLEVNIFLLSL